VQLRIHYEINTFWLKKDYRYLTNKSASLANTEYLRNTLVINVHQKNYII